MRFVFKVVALCVRVVARSFFRLSSLSLLTPPILHYCCYFLTLTNASLAVIFTRFLRSRETSSGCCIRLSWQLLVVVASWYSFYLMFCCMLTWPVLSGEWESAVRVVLLILLQFKVSVVLLLTFSPNMLDAKTICWWSTYILSHI